MSPLRRTLVMLALVMAGEAAFVLPFVIPRVFRPTVLDTFGITNLQLGSAFSVYGVVAMASYVLGGPLADRFSARSLLAIGLVTTAAGGAIYARIPSLATLTILFGFWGASSVLLFWAALIRATREWGGHNSQGRAYGLLDGGRGLFAALLASLTVFVFAAMLPTDPATATLAERSRALSQIIWICTGFTFVVAAFVFVAIPRATQPAPEARGASASFAGMFRIIRMPAVWLQAVIVICAYVGYKCTDDFSLYARDAYGYNDVAAAQIGTISFWVRPFAAMAAGFIGDRVTPSLATAWSFAGLIVGALAIALGLPQEGLYWTLALTVAGASVAIYALRGLYFALFNEARVPLAFTGSAVGVVSVLGYTPDIFMGPLMGFLVDRSPGELGHQHLFATLAAFGALGLAATLAFRRVSSEEDAEQFSKSPS